MENIIKEVATRIRETRLICEISEEENRYPIEMAVQMQSILQGIYDSAAAGEEVEIKL